MRVVEVKRRFAISLALFLATVGVSQAQTAAPQAGAKPRQLMMWKVASPTTTVYLVGSMHLADKDLYPLPEVMESAFRASSVLVEEINLKKVDQAAALKLVQQYGIYPEGDSLSKHLPRKTLDAVDAFCSKHSFPRPVLEKFRPWMVAITVEALTLQQAGEDANLGLDLHFLNESKEPQKVEELETADYQMTVLSSGTEAEQEAMLAHTLEEMDDPAKHVQEIKDALLSGDPEVMEKFLEKHSQPRSLYKKLLDDRNGPMADKIDGYLKGKEQCFVVVGAGHLVGDNGIVKLLEEKNYKPELIRARIVSGK